MFVYNTVHRMSAKSYPPYRTPFKWQLLLNCSPKITPPNQIQYSEEINQTDKNGRGQQRESSDKGLQLNHSCVLRNNATFITNAKLE